MAPGTESGLFDHTWYKPAHRTERERAMAAAGRLARWCELAMNTENEYLAWFFDLECGLAVHRVTVGFREPHIATRDKG
jgi:hypothetical protein